MILAIILLFILSYLIILYFKKRTNIFFYNSNAPNLNHILVDYISKISKYEIGFKTNNHLSKLHQKQKILRFYKANILNFNNDEKEILTFYVKYINKLLVDYDFITKVKWNFIKLSPVLEKEMPFTLGEHIFIPQQMIENMRLGINNPDIFIGHCDTLIHEKLHVIQRMIPNKFKEFYIKHLKSIPIKNLEISDYWKKYHLKNPDGLDIRWVYKHRGKYYLPMLIFNNKLGSIKQIVILLKNFNGKFYTTKHSINAYEFPKFMNYPRYVSVYHPNEISAYIIPKILLRNKKINKNLDKLFLSFINNHLKNISIF